MKFIQIEILDTLAILRISRPEALNALSIQIMEELGQALQQACQTPEVKGIVITGDGEKAFVAGADIKELSGLGSEKASDLSKKGHEIFKKVETSPKPVIAIVNGFALGGGCELAMACHMRIATESARFGLPEVNLGIIPGYGGTQRLPQLVGRGKALELLLTGEMIGAMEAKNIGLVNHVVADKQQAMEMAKSILGKITSKAPLAIAHVIEAVNAGYQFEQHGYEAEAENFGRCAATEDFKEGTAAFLEKRLPLFKGR